MCGLVGYFNLDSSSVFDNKAISKMMILQKHRGPDDSGILGIHTPTNFYQNVSHKDTQVFDHEVNLVLGFNRLSILDLSSNGHQPMISYDRRAVIMMNGEIYNAFDFTDDLKLKGYKFKGKSDTEVALNLYLEYGIDGMLERLNGMFAIVIYDFCLKKLFLIRDRVGIKPLYVLMEENRVAFSSEIKSFKALPDFKFEIDTSCLDEFLLFRNLINDTLYKGITNCTPGTYIEISNDGQIKQVVYYSINQENSIPYAGDVKNRLSQILSRSVERQMISDVKLGCQLSGGVDSSLITYYANQTLESGQLETVSIVFDNPKYNEKQYIDKVASQLHLKSHQFRMDADTYFDIIDKVSWHFENPINHPNTIGIYLLSQEAKRYVTVLLSGEGADEILAGYSHFIHKGNLFNKGLVRKLLYIKSNELQTLSYLFNPRQRLIMQTSFGSINTANTLYQNFNFDRAIARRENIFKNQSGSKLLQHRKYEILTYLPDLLMRQDKMSMAHSIENRVPFLDNSMLELSMQIEDNNLIKKVGTKVQTKLILKEICADIYGNDFAYRNKMGFSIPLIEFMSSEKFQKRWATELLPGIQKRGLFNYKVLSKYMENLKNLKGAELDAIWLMTSFEIWAQQFIDS